MARPRIFIAAAGESLDVAYAIQSNLENDAECTVWTQAVMRLSRSTAHNLTTQLDNSDFGIFVFNPDDVVLSRGGEYAGPRDNVVLELGMFAGRLGVESTFIVMPRAANIKVPSDLLGLSVSVYAPDREDGNLEAALGPACNAIRKELKDFKRRPTVAESRDDRQKEVSARVEARIELGVGLDPIVRALANAADELRRAKTRDIAGIRRHLRNDVVNLAVQIAPQVVGPAGSTRACYLNLEEGPPTTLVPTGHVAGRRVSKRQEPFVAGTEHGDYVIGKLKNGEPDFYPNLDEDAPPGFDPRSVEYKTFISVPVVAGKTAYGALTADARRAGDLSDVDVDFMFVLAGLVAAAMALASEA